MFNFVCKNCIKPASQNKKKGNGAEPTRGKFAMSSLNFTSNITSQ